MKARAHFRMTHSLSLGVRGRLLQVSTLWSIGPVMPHSASTRFVHPQHWMWLVLAPRKEPFRSTTLSDAIMKEKQDLPPRHPLEASGNPGGAVLLEVRGV